MKKQFLWAVSLLCALTISAKPYQHSFGINVGSSYGLSYKGYVRSSDHFIVITDLNVHLIRTQGVGIYQSTDYKYDDGTTATSDLHDNFGKTKMVGYTFEANPNLGYQGDISEFGWGSMHWFAGGGISMGFGQFCNFEDTKYEKDAWKALKDERKVWKDLDSDDRSPRTCPYVFKVGMNAIAGIEMCFSNAPLNLSLDFRPGWGEFIVADRYRDVDATLTPCDVTMARGLAYFDWGVNLALRYRF